MTERTVSHVTFTVEKTYPHRPAKVFAAHSDPALKRRWFAEGEGWNVESYELDFAVNGRETSTFRFQGGPLIRNDTVFQDIVENERIVFAYSMMIGDERISASLSTIELRPDGAGGTRLSFTEQGAYLDGLSRADEREEGTRQLFEALARELDAA